MSATSLPHRLLIGLVLLVTVWAYRGVWNAQFVYEDENAVFANLAVTGQQPVQLWRARALTAVSHRLVYKAFGAGPRAPHVVNLGLHLCNGLLVYAVALTWVSPLAAILAMSVFLLHPIQVESVAYVASRSELLAATFALLALWGSLQATKWWQHGLIVLSVVLAVWAKESAAVIVPLMAVTALYRGRSVSWFRLACCLVPIGGMAWSVWHREYLFRPDASWFGYIQTQAVAIGRYLGLVIVPWGFSIDHDFDLVPTVVRLIALIVLIGAATSFALLMGTVGDERKQITRAWMRFDQGQMVCFGATWFLVALLPRLIVPLNEALNEHQLLIPLIGIWIALAAVALPREVRVCRSSTS